MVPNSLTFACSRSCSVPAGQLKGVRCGECIVGQGGRIATQHFIILQIAALLLIEDTAVKRGARKNKQRKKKDGRRDNYWSFEELWKQGMEALKGEVWVIKRITQQVPHPHLWDKQKQNDQTEETTQQRKKIKPTPAKVIPESCWHVKPKTRWKTSGRNVKPTTEYQRWSLVSFVSLFIAMYF